MPKGIEKGRTYRLVFNGGTVPIKVYRYGASGSTIDSKVYSTDADIEIRSDMSAVLFRFNIE